MRIHQSMACVLTTTMLLAGCWDQEQRFDSAAWKDAAGCEQDNRRLGMVGPLETAELTVGMTESAVLALLGPPERTTETLYVYCLGYNIIDYDSYYIEFDANRAVTSWRYVQG